MLKLLAPLTVLAFVAGVKAQSRTCTNQGTLDSSVVEQLSTIHSGTCASGSYYREFLPKDIKQISVTVEKVTSVTDANGDPVLDANGDPVKSFTAISQFDLSNSAGQDQASGSLDNIEQGTYRVQVKAKAGDAHGNFQEGTCDWTSAAGYVLFEGTSSEVVVAGDGRSTKVEIFMESCHNSIDFVAAGVAPPVYPSYVTSVVIDADSAVLGANGEVEVTITVTNANTDSVDYSANPDYSNSGVRAKFNSAGDRRSPASKAKWTVEVYNHGDANGDPSLPSKTLGTSDKYFVGNKAGTTGKTDFKFGYSVGSAENTYTTELEVQPFAYAGAATNKELDSIPADLNDGNFRSAGNLYYDFIVAPVGDLDLEVIYFSGLRLNFVQPVNVLNSNAQSSPGLFQLQGHYDQNDVAVCSGRKTGSGTGRWDYIIPNDEDSSAKYKIDFFAETLYSLDRSMTFTLTPIDCDDATLSLNSLYQTEQDSDSSDQIATHEVSGSSTGSRDTITFSMIVQVTPISGALHNSICSFKVSGVTSANTGDQTSTVSASAQVVLGQKEFVCNPNETNFNPEKKKNSTVPYIYQFGQATPCPLIKTIVWGSTDHWSQSSACGKAGAVQSKVSFCAIYNSDLGTFVESDFRIDVFGINNNLPSVSFTGSAFAAGAYQAGTPEDPCFEAKNGNQNGNGLTDAATVYMPVQVIFAANAFKHAHLGDGTLQGLCSTTSDAEFGARIVTQNMNGGAGPTDANDDTCRDNSLKTDYTNPAKDDSPDKTLFCANVLENDALNGEKTDASTDKQSCEVDERTTEAPTLRKLLSSSPGCPANSPFTCPADNRMPFDIKIEDGRLTVSMDTKAIGDKKVVIAANPQGLLPKRSRFIASDFAAASNSWATGLRAKLDFILQDESRRQNIKPGATAQSLVACCGFSLEEGETLAAAMSSIVDAEDAQIFKPTITIGGGNTGPTSNQQQQTTSTQTTSTHTTEKSSDDSSSGGSLLVVVAVAAVLVLVAVIALAIFTVKSNKQSQRVVDLRGGNDKQSSWQKGGAMESDF